MSTKETNPKSKTRVSLSKERVLVAAVILADEGGVASLTMRKLAERLNVEAMSLYHHIATKEEVLDGMVDIVFGEIELPSCEADWKTAIRQRALSARAVFSRHPWAIGLMESRTNPGPMTLRNLDAVVGSLRKAGFSITMAAHAFSVLDSYVYGFVLQEVRLPYKTSDELEKVAETILRQMPEDRYSYLDEMIREQALKPGYDYAKEFEFGLDLILDGLERFPR
jgi:AcrR family transcriptional regulator